MSRVNGEIPDRSGFVARPYSSFELGQELWDALTITESHVVMAAGAFNDPGPNHVISPQAAAGRFGRRVAHGPLLVGIADGVIGNVLGATIVALLEQRAVFLAPAHPGDTAIVRWEVVSLTDKASLGGGIVDFRGWIANQEGERLVELEAKLAVAERPPWTPWDHIEAAEERGRPEYELRDERGSDR